MIQHPVSYTKFSLPLGLCIYTKLISMKALVSNRARKLSNVISMIRPLPVIHIASEPAYVISDNLIIN